MWLLSSNGVFLVAAYVGYGQTNFCRASSFSHQKFQKLPAATALETSPERRTARLKLRRPAKLFQRDEMEAQDILGTVARRLRNMIRELISDQNRDDGASFLNLYPGH